MLTSFGGVHAARRAASSASGISTSTRRLFRSMRIGSPDFSSARPPPTAASGETLRMEGLPEVPLCRPSPMVGSVSTPAFSSAAGGCMFTTSALPG